MTRIPIHSVADLGQALRATRKAQGVRLDDLAGTAQVSHVFVIDVEHGKPTVQMGKVLQVLREAGLTLNVELSPDALTRFHALRATAPTKPVRRKRASPAMPKTA